jgi:hypothetical protein
MTSKGFEVGDIVQWTSQAAGSSTTKQGTVVEVVAINTAPKHREQIKDCGRFRPTESYVVKVDRGEKVKPKFYWPLVSLLRMIKSVQSTKAGGITPTDGDVTTVVSG